MDVSNFISPKELIRIKGEIVEQALARSNPIIAMEYNDGVVLMAENPSETLNKVSEIYDHIAFAGTGVYNDYERLRRAGVQYADVKGFSYSRRDVKARAIATEYSSILGDIFARQQLPWEVEILVVEIGTAPADNRMYMIPFSGGLVEEKKHAVIGDIHRDDDGDLQRGTLRKKLTECELSGEAGLDTVVGTGYRVLCSLKGDDARIPASDLEVVTLDRTVNRPRKFRRLQESEVEPLIST